VREGQVSLQRNVKLDTRKEKHNILIPSLDSI
jgi:hypothetical protein